MVLACGVCLKEFKYKFLQDDGSTDIDILYFISNQNWHMYCMGKAQNPLTSCNMSVVIAIIK